MGGMAGTFSHMLFIHSIQSAVDEQRQMYMSCATTGSPETGETLRPANI